MTKQFWVLLLVLLAFQSQPVRLTVRSILVDKDLNQKPVPKMTLVLTRLDSSSPPTTIKTGFDGVAEASLAPGKYRLTTPQPTEFQGKQYRWEQEITLSGSEQIVELSNDNALASETADSSSSGSLNVLFDQLKNSVVKVYSEKGDGSGFLIDSAGLVLTNNHVVESSSYLAVQFDQKRKVAAALLAADPEKDLAVLWVNLSVYSEAVIAPLPATGASPTLAVGDRIFTIGNPLGKTRVLTTGVVSKIEMGKITSDININPGNSGGPLLTLAGQVAGVTTALLQKLAIIIPIEDARPLIEQARGKLKSAGVPAPSAALLPVEPEDYFPADSLRPLLKTEKLDTKPYYQKVGEFEVGFFTPTLMYFYRHKSEMDAARKTAKHQNADAADVNIPTAAVEDAQGYRPVIEVGVYPRQSVWNGKFKNGFQRMRLLCGGKEVPPIEPRRIPYLLRDFRGRTVDNTFSGLYLYPPDSVSPSCGTLSVEIFSEKDPNTPVNQAVESGIIERVWADFEPYRKAHAAAQNSVPQKK
jgi:S1-C subfamily serine protease